MVVEVAQLAWHHRRSLEQLMGEKMQKRSAATAQAHRSRTAPGRPTAAGSSLALAVERDGHSAAPPSPFSRCFNGEGESAPAE